MGNTSSTVRQYSLRQTATAVIFPAVYTACRHLNYPQVEFWVFAQQLKFRREEWTRYSGEVLDPKVYDYECFGFARKVQKLWGFTWVGVFPSQFSEALLNTIARSVVRIRKDIKIGCGKYCFQYHWPQQRPQRPLAIR